MLQEESRILLSEGIRLLELKLTEGQIYALEDYVQLLIKWNKTYNLTSITEQSEIIKKHILDSLSIVKYILDYLEGSTQILDVGSGGGFPAIPCAIALPKVNFNLVDPIVKKTRFLQQVQINLKLNNIRVFNDRVENLNIYPKIKVATCRAFSSLETFVQATERLMAEDCSWLAMKGKIPEEEIENLPKGIYLDSCLKLSVPFLEGSRHLLILRRCR